MQAQTESTRGLKSLIFPKLTVTDIIIGGLVRSSVYIERCALFYNTDHRLSSVYLYFISVIVIILGRFIIGGLFPCHFKFASSKEPNTLEQYGNSISAKEIDMTSAYPVINGIPLERPVYKVITAASDIADPVKAFPIFNDRHSSGDTAFYRAFVKNIRFGNCVCGIFNQLVTNIKI
mgnify:CR=1 FL=1